jgi:hypothetical protein
MITDRVYLVDGARAAKLHAAVTKSPVYFYLFGYRGKHSFTEVNAGTANNYGKKLATTTLNAYQLLLAHERSLPPFQKIRKQMFILLFLIPQNIS